MNRQRIKLLAKELERFADHPSLGNSPADARVILKTIDMLTEAIYERPKPEEPAVTQSNTVSFTTGGGESYEVTTFFDPPLPASYRARTRVSGKAREFTVEDIQWKRFVPAEKGGGE